MDKVLPNILRALRARSSLKQGDVVESGREIGGNLTQAMISKWEIGKREPRFYALLQVLEIVGASLVDVEVYLQIFNRYPPDKPLEPLTETELAALPQLDRRMRQFVVAKPGSLRSRILYHAIKGQVLMEAIGDESEKLTAYIEERFRAAEEAP